MQSATHTQPPRLELSLQKDIYSIPHGIVVRLLTTLLSFNYACFNYNAQTGVVTIDCQCFFNHLKSYVESKEFDENVKKLLNLLNGMLIKRLPPKCKARRVQDAICKTLDLYKLNPDMLIKNALKVDIGFSKNELKVELGVAHSKRDFIDANYAPLLFRLFDYVESARIYPHIQLVTKPSPRGYKRSFYITCEHYALVAIAAARAYLGTFRPPKERGSVIFYFIVTLEPNREIGSRLPAAVNILRKFISSLTRQKISLNDVPEPLLYLTLLDAIRAPLGVAEIIGLKQRGLRGDIVIEFSVDFSLSRHVRTALIHHASGFRMADLVATIVKDLIKSSDERKVKLASIFAQILEKFALIATVTGDVYNAYVEALRMLNDRELIELINRVEGDKGGMYQRAYRILPELLKRSVKLLETLV